jgi:putative addiction module component (TIGR02574 family)
MSQLPQDIEHLSAAEIDALWQSQESETFTLTPEQRAELRDRVARYRKDPSDVIPWEQVKADLLRER